MHFSDLALSEPILRAVRAEGYETPTPIQQRAIPLVLAGRDVLGCAQTGTGKTAAFALPILHRLALAPRAQRPHIRALVLSPTRELALQIGDSFGTYGRNTGLRHTVVFGGVGQAPQEKALRHGVDILVATPGRLLDLMSQGLVPLGRLEVFVLDEADRMLDMGFIHDVRKVIAAIPAKRQTLLFSATMPPPIQQLAANILRDPAFVEVAPVSSTADRIDQSVYFVDKVDKRGLLAHVLRDSKIRRALVFTRTKHGANRVAEGLVRGGERAEAIHGNKSQNARQRALEGFKTGSVRVLVATDIAARGIDVDDVTHVINFDLPNEPESYVHRIGRTARAGASGVAISFCDAEEHAYLRDIERLIRQRVAVVEAHPFKTARAPSANREAHASGPTTRFPPPMPDRRAHASGGGHRPGQRPGGQRPAHESTAGRSEHRSGGPRAEHGDRGVRRGTHHGPGPRRP
jgi:ATP-dependent RNA helicase RhlE